MTLTVVSSRKLSKLARHTGELYVPDGSWISPLSVERMARLLAGAPRQVRAVVAPVDVLPAGSTAPVHAEQLALLPGTAVESVTTSFVAGAAYARPGVHVEVGHHGVDVDLQGGLLLIDQGSYLHEPRRSPRVPVEVASVLAAAPFRWRPDVAFVLLDDPLHTIVHLSGLADALIERSIDARLLVGPAVGIRATNGGPVTRLVQPALAIEATLDVLSPDVLVPLDAAAAALCARWSTGRRDVVLATDPDRLVLRSPGAVATQVQRWASGPHPLDAAQVASFTTVPVSVSVAITSSSEDDDGPIVACGARPAKRRAIALLTGPATATAVRRNEGLAAVLTATGDSLVIVPREDVLPRLAELVAADVVVVSGELSPCCDREIREVGARRQARGRPMVLDGYPGQDGAAFVHADWVTQWSGAGSSTVPALEVPVAIPLDRQHTIAAATPAGPPPRGTGAEISFGWWLDPPMLEAELTQRFVQGLAEGLAERLSQSRELRLFVLCDPRALPPVLSRLPNTIALPLAPVSPSVLAQWSVQITTPRSGHDVPAIASVIEAGLAGVPVLTGAELVPAIPFPLAADSVFSEVPTPSGVAAWFEAIDRLIEDEAAGQAAGRSIRRLAHAACGPEALADEAERLFARISSSVDGGRVTKDGP